MKAFGLCLLIACCALPMKAQKYFTRDGQITFTSEAPMEKIQADNNKVSSVIDLETGDIEFAVLIKSFHFEKALMEEHFNENYLESSKYPKATFKGKVDNVSALKASASGKHALNVSGDLTIHGVTKHVTVEAQFAVDKQMIQASATFAVPVADYEIEIPKVVRDNVAKEVEISVQMQYKPLEK